ncbi:MAG: ATP-binding cassette domain-containing protein [Promethearchaeota archaeon]
MTKNIIETFNLTKIYKLRDKNKDIEALNNVNLSIKEGEIFGLLGPNGAGKTTFIQILTTLIQPTGGYAVIDGHDIIKNPILAKQKIALMLGFKMLYYRITAYDNLKFFCRIYKIHNYKEKIFRMAEEFGLKKWINQYVENFSSGMMMKLALLRTMLLDRKILFLDEPTAGLDVQTKSFIVDRIKNSDSTIFITSHDMKVVEKVCDRIAFINNGNLIKIGTKEDIQKLERVDIAIEVEINRNKDQLKNELEQQAFIKEINGNNKGLEIHIKDRDYYQEILSILGKYKITKIKEIEYSLEDLFVKLIYNK